MTPDVLRGYEVTALISVSLPPFFINFLARISGTRAATGFKSSGNVALVCRYKIHGVRVFQLASECNTIFNIWSLI